MKTANKLNRLIPSLFVLAASPSLRADIIIPTLQQIDDRKAHQRYCHGYADNAVQQYKKSQALGCGFNGSRWNNDRHGQYNWCLTVLEPFSATESRFRADALETCQQEKGSANNPNNQLSVPTSCKDTADGYRPVKSINHFFRYETAITSPVTGGIIRYDYNRDGTADLVFLENKQQKSRVVMCFSQPQGMRRQLTDIEIFSDSGGIGSWNYDIDQTGDILQIGIRYFEHNAGSSESTNRYQFDQQAGKFKLLEHQSDASPVYYDGEPYPMYVPPAPKLF